MTVIDRIIEQMLAMSEYKVLLHSKKMVGTKYIDVPESLHKNVRQNMRGLLEEFKAEIISELNNGE